MAFNVVELATADSDDCGFDQRCRFGHRVEGHAVYCHNDNWDDAPRKCRRSWATNGEIKDEDCAGFEVNPNFAGTLEPTPIDGDVCTRCRGKKRIGTDRGKTETCPLCMGSGSEPKAIELTVYEQETLEVGTGHSGRHDTAGHRFIRIAENDMDCASIQKLIALNLVVFRSVSYGVNVAAYLLENTMRGESVMRKNWKSSNRYRNV